MKIVQLETQDERSLSARQALARQAELNLLQTASFEGFLLAAAHDDVDLLLAHHRTLFTRDEIESRPSEAGFPTFP
jgi:hypothetical protein